jgi:tetratricopeptide (TPR) repeat protein
MAQEKEGTARQTAGGSATLALVDLPGLLQQFAAQRRTGVMRVGENGGGRFRDLHLNNGQLTALTGGDTETFAKALVWSKVLTRNQVNAVHARMGEDHAPERLLKALMGSKVVTRDALLDALDCYIEEEFTVLVGWNQPELSFVEQPSTADWPTLQAKAGVAVNLQSVLMESVRRQDELMRVKDHMPHPWDALIRDQDVAEPADLSEDAASILADGQDGMVANSIYDHPSLTPFRARVALGTLVRLGVLRPARLNELVIEADAAYAHGKHDLAYGIYKRTIELGLSSPRVQLHLAELAERAGHKEDAAAAYLTAAGQLSDPKAVVAALRRAQALGADREQALTQLVAAHRKLGNNPEAIEALLQLAKLHGEAGHREQAARAVREAQELGADPGETALQLARLARDDGDREQAVLRLEQAARAFHEGERGDDAIAAWRELLTLLPGRLEYAKECAELLVWNGDKDAALGVLRKALDSQTDAGEDVLVQTYELLSRLDPSDVKAHDYLAQAYERRRDRDGATKQLKMAASAQEKAGSYPELATTLERILELGGNKIETWRWLAKTRLHLRQENLAAEAWCQAVDAALGLGLLKETRQTIEGALSALPGSWALRQRLAQVANREGDRATAVRQFLLAADLARGAGDAANARDLLAQAVRLRPDDLQARLRMVECAEDAKDPNLDTLLSELVQLAGRTHNHGVALDLARKRVAIAGGMAIDQRLELVELLRLTGDTGGQLTTGKELLNDLLEHGEFDRALKLLSRLVASHPRNSELVLQLAEVHAALGDEQKAYRFYRHAVPLLQVDGKLTEAKVALDLIAGMSQAHELPLVALARERIEKNQPLDWEKLRAEIDQDQLRRAAQAG